MPHPEEFWDGHLCRCTRAAGFACCSTKLCCLHSVRPWRGPRHRAASGFQGEAQAGARHPGDAAGPLEGLCAPRAPGGPKGGL